MHPFRKTKIICTIGPSSWDYPILKHMAQIGMDIVRLNFSHGSHQEKKDQIDLVRKISHEIGKNLAIMADLQGPKLRLGEIDGIKEIKKGDKVHLSLNPTEDELPIQFDLSPFVKKGQRIYLNDGLVELKVTEVMGKTIKSIAQNDGIVTSHKGVNVPDTDLKEASFSQKDYEDAIFALKEGADYIALSFVQDASDLKKAQKLIQEYNPKVKIIVKIEKNEAITNLEEIVKQSDAIMVARGDLAIEADNATVPILQQKMIKICRQYQKPVIIATQMLESMIENPRPTRAEVSDVANAVFDQVDCVMLSAESASGKYPVEAVKTMRNIIESVEQYPDYKHQVQIDWEKHPHTNIYLMAIASSAISLASRIKAKAIVVGTTTGITARVVSSFRPDSKLIAITHDTQTRNQLNMVWGTEGMIVKPTDNFNLFFDNIQETLKSSGQFQKGDQVVIVFGRAAGISGTTNTIKIASF